MELVQSVSWAAVWWTLCSSQSHRMVSSSGMFSKFCTSYEGHHPLLFYFIVLYCIVLYCILLYCIVLYCIVLYCIVLYCIVRVNIHICDIFHLFKPVLAIWANRLLHKYMYVKHDTCWLCLTTFPNAKKRVENMTRSRVFLTNFKVYGYIVSGKTLLRVVDMWSSQSKLRSKRSNKVIKVHID